jgi:hypothetical protein
MRILWVAVLCLAFAPLALTQNSDEPPSRDDVILYLQTMHSHDMMRRIMEVQSASMQELLTQQLSKDGKVPPDFATHFKKAMDDMIQGMPVDEMTQAMIPAYQKHFTKGDIEAMNGFYSSPVGQKVLQELPTVTQEGMQAMMPMLSEYLAVWKVRMQQEFKSTQKSTAAAAPDSSPKN